jgi:hypothetical protein
MKTITAIFLILSITVYSQTEKNSNTIVSVSIHSIGNTSNKNVTELNKDLFSELSNLGSLHNFNYSTEGKIEKLDLELKFSDMEAFFEWYEMEETKNLLSKLESNFKKSSLNVKLVKQPDLK